MGVSKDMQVGYSAIVFYGYVGVIGLALWAMLKWWFKSEVGLAQVWCIYGARSPDTCTPLSISQQCMECTGTRLRPNQESALAASTTSDWPQESIGISRHWSV